MSALVRKVLVLNKTWTPIAVVTVRRAICLLFSVYDDDKPKAVIIDPTSAFQTFTWSDWSKIKPKNDEEVLRGTEVIFRIPEVILLNRYNKLPQTRTNFSRLGLFRRDNYTCIYCGKRPGSSSLTVDHLTPRRLGGQTEWTNVACCCLSCNIKKGGRTPEMAGMKLLWKPTKPKFSLVHGDVKIDSWSAFISEAYWNCELEN
jgi:5-methylcytosine-specific restriction endonuclease McrA